MGISTGCAIVVGFQGEDLYDLLSPELQARIDEEGWWAVVGEEGTLGLDGYSPAFNCDPQYNYWGVRVYSTYSHGEEIGTDAFDDFRGKVESARARFKAITGLDGKLYMTPNVS